MLRRWRWAGVPLKPRHSEGYAGLKDRNRIAVGSAGLAAIARCVLAIVLMLAAGSALAAQPATQPPALSSAIASALPKADPAPEPAPDPVRKTPSEAVASFDADARHAEAVLRTDISRHDYDEVRELNLLRDRLAADRDLARGIADRSNLDARIIQAQITALGPLPESGKTEASAITDQRKALDARLSVALGPVLRAREAQARAATLVSDLDERIAAIDRLRKSERASSVLDPRLWLTFAGDARRGAEAMAAGFARGYEAIGFLGLASRVLGAAALMLLGPFASAWLLRVLSARLAKRIENVEQLASRLLIVVLEDVSTAIALFFGIGCTIAAMGLVLKPFVTIAVLVRLSTIFVLAALIVAITQWLAKGTLQSPFVQLRLVRLRPALVDKGVSTVRWIGVVMAMEAIVEALEQAGFASATAIDLISGLLLILGGGLIWVLANLLHKGREGQDEATASDGKPPEMLDFASPLSRILKLLVIGSVSAALVGYIILAREIFSDAVLSIAVIAIAIFLHRLISLVLGLLAEGRFKRYRTTLHFVPMLTGLVITLCTVPMLAVTWGYNSREIGDAIVTLRSGVTIGQVNLSAGDILTFAFIFLAGYVATRWTQRIINLSILPQFGLDRGSQASIVTMIGYAGIVLAAVIAIASTGLDLSSLAFVAGALSVGLGFGLQSIVENFTSGVILLIERPIREGDWIEVGNFSGIVRKVSVRSTHLESFDRHQIIIPNSQLITGSVKNLSLGAALARVVVPVGVAYSSDLEKVRAVLLEIAHANPGVLPSPAPSVTLDAFAESSINMRLLLFVPDATDGASIASQVRFAIAERFGKEGIELPFPQREVRIRRD